MHPLDEGDHARRRSRRPGPARPDERRLLDLHRPVRGTSAATALRAVLEHPAREGDPLAVTVNFCAPIERGEFAVHLRVARANRSSQHWLVEFRQGESAGCRC
jgi:hypothetical protein